MSAMVRARLAGSDASGGFGRPWATSQKLQRRVHTSPRIMKVAVPWLKHSWMFGQLASSHTVTRRFSRSLLLSCCTALPEGRRTRIQLGLRSVGAASNFTGLRAILSSPICLTPSRSGASTEGMVLGADSEDIAKDSGGDGGRGERGGQARLEDRLQAELFGELGYQHRLDFGQRGGTAAF